MHWTLRNKPWCFHWHLFTDYGSLWFLFLISRLTTITYNKFVFSTDQSFPNPWRIIRFVTRVTQWAPHVEQELLTLPKHPGFLWGSCCTICSVLYCVLEIIVYQVVLFFSPLHCVSFQLRLLITWLPLFIFSYNVMLDFLCLI